MLQRSQSLYLLFVFIFAILLFTGPLAFVTQEIGGVYLKHSGVFDLDGENMGVSTWPLSVMIGLSVLGSILAFLSYMNRPRQMRLTLFLMFFNVGFIGIAYYYVSYIMHNFEGVQFVFQWRVVVPLIMLVLLVLAFRGIRKDELLVKAADRIR
jgi:hypothetical protein